MRHIGIMIIGLLALCASGVAAAQSVYKCETPAGTVYSGQPCAAAGSPQMQELDLPATAPVVGDGMTRAEREMLDDYQDGLRRDHRQAAERRCVNSRMAAAKDATAARIDGYQARIASLRRNLRRANNNLAGATWGNGLRQQIAALQGSISAEKSALTQLAIGARRVCAQARMRSMRAGRRH